MLKSIITVALGSLLLNSVSQAQQLEYSQLVNRAHNLIYLCDLPKPGERSEQLHFDFEGGEFEYLIKGPAVITRVFVNAGDGNLSIDFADDNFEVNLQDLPRLTQEPFAIHLGNAVSISLPISISGESKLKLSSSSASTISLDIWYPPTGVNLVNSGNKYLKSKSQVIRTAANIIKGGNRFPTNPDTDPQKIGATYFRSPDLPPSTTNGEFRWLIRGSGVLRWIEIKFIHAQAPATLEKLLRSLVLRIEHGNESIEDEASVVTEIPLGDFFGAYYGEGNSANYLVGYNPNTQSWYCRLPIPFKDSIRFSIASDLPEVARLMMKAGLDRLAPDSVPPLTLRSNFVRAVAKSQATAAKMKVDGPARILGSMFSVTSSSSSFVNQDDDFSFSNSRLIPQTVIAEQVALREGPGAFGNNSIARWYYSSAPSSAEGLNYDPQLKLPSDEESDYSFVTWWYGAIDSKVEGATTYPAAQRQHPPRPQAKFFRIQDAIEAEHTAVPRMSKNSIASIVFVDSDLPVSSLQYTNWMPAGPSQAVIYDFGIADSGKFDFSVQFMTGPQFGKVQVLVDGYSLGEVIDCNSDELGVTEVINLGQKRMMARDSHTIGFRSVDEKAVGIDCYLIEKVEK